MFTGIITGVGRIAAIDMLGDTIAHGKRLHLSCPPGYLNDVTAGDSIALNGACMTVTRLDAAAPVNLEKAMRAHDRLGGHIVSGHVDGVGRVTALEPVGESWELRVEAPRSLARFLAYKGSVTVNGVSLTVNRVHDTSTDCEISINLIPHTVHNTALGTLERGARVNLEIDLIARYVERMLSTGLELPHAAAHSANRAPLITESQP